MAPERWQQIERVYHAAAARPAGDRVRFLDGECAGDAELRAEVERMLVFDAASGGFLDASAVEVAVRALAAGELAGGSRLGPYEIVSLLGRGGMGEVYEARDPRLHRTVAIKLLPALGAADVERRARFLREARAASALNHPNIVTVHDILSEEGRDALVMEYLAGQTLEEKIAGKGLPLSQAVDFSIQIADALATAHAAGIVHRDIKPGNIIVTGEKSGAATVKVLDFGLATFTGGQTEAERTQTIDPGDRRIVGTAAYMSPEQAEGRKVDARSDIFSFGVVLYEMLTGRKAFLRDTTTSTLAAILRDEFEPVPGIPESMCTLLARCLRKDPAKRAQSVADIKVSLEEIREERGRPPAETHIGARQWWKRVVLATGVAAIAVAGWLVIGRRNPEPSLVVKPLTSYPGVALSPSFSPDGSQVAFYWNGEKQDNYDIYVKMVDSGALLRLTRDPAVDSWPSWSPDGRQIAFLRAVNPGTRELRLISPLGGAERKLADLREESNQLVFWAAPAWSPDGRFLAVRDETAIVVVSAESGEKRKLTSPPAGWIGDSFPSISPDGRQLAFARMRVNSIGQLLLTAVSAGTKTRQLAGDELTISGLSWTADGKEIVFSSRRAGDPTLWRISASGGTAEMLPAAGADAVYPAIARQGRRAAFARATHRSSFWRLDLSPQGLGRPPTMLMTSSRRDRGPAVSPDGSHIAFVSDRSGTGQIWLCDSNGANAVQLTSLEGGVGIPHWSPDSRNIVFTGHTEGRRVLFEIAATGGKPRQLSSEEISTPSWSRDGRWIYFLSSRTGSDQLWKIPAEGGSIVQLTKGGGGPGMESIDGRYFCYHKFADGALWKVPAQGGQETLVTRENINGLDRWALGREGLYFTEPKGVEHKTTLKLFRLDTGRIHQIAVLEQPFPSTGTRLSLPDDGRWLLYEQVDRNESDIVLMENFR